jgi:carbonic anhydrase
MCCEAAVEDLIAGYRRFRSERWPRMRALYQRLARGQTPRMLVIACSDSRVDPATIFDAEPGELFVIRNVANLVPPYEEGGGYHGTSAAIEFAVEQLQVQTVLVMGHAMCGGCAAAVAGPHQKDSGSFLDAWVSLLEPAKASITAHTGEPATATAMEYEGIKMSLENLLSFPFVAKRVREGKLKLQGARYGVADGGLEVLDPASGSFIPVD